MSGLRAWNQCAALLVVLARPSICLYTGGSLTILSQNNLGGAPNDGTSAILVHQPTPFHAASASCTLLGETPWQPDIDNKNIDNTSTSTVASLQYQESLGIAARQLYWVGKKRLVNATGVTLAPLPNSLAAATDASSQWRVVQSVNGTMMTGYRDLHAWMFRGIRYAEPPVRFAYAEKAACTLSSPNVLAVDAGADCSQPIGEAKSGSSDNCLFANEWALHLPRMDSQTSSFLGLKPVMLYLYGGSFTSGSGKDPTTDGTNLTSRGDVVVVSVNYRVGNASFLVFDDGVHRGNYVLSDIVATLEWVRDYARFFGGDSTRVTLFGEAAGAQATHVLLGSPKVQGLFQRTIIQSDPQGYPRHDAFSWM
ncbi:camp-regulated d2 protein [Ophiostoma piceae UAMH 11346]|uniref:Camp-regulated d2 protein n=1 Tax=Ophiostoma piceae (strain UAMH 11346) TaxID=1262450 RepID=S3BSU4_OPHP1|nr:camp-regulated d2 protein [Ophiostoma piceae UAMH 11346]